jgi:hypothetical protein
MMALGMVVVIQHDGYRRPRLEKRQAIAEALRIRSGQWHAPEHELDKVPIPTDVLLSATVYRYDNFPDPAWQAVATFPHHFHHGTA